MSVFPSPLAYCKPLDERDEGANGTGPDGSPTVRYNSWIGRLDCHETADRGGVESDSGLHALRAPVVNSDETTSDAVHS